jgi:hypothetical protein
VYLVIMPSPVTRAALRDALESLPREQLPPK